jgi:hypothetical protein
MQDRSSPPSDIVSVLLQFLESPPEDTGGAYHMNENAGTVVPLPATGPQSAPYYYPSFPLPLLFFCNGPARRATKRRGGTGRPNTRYSNPDQGEKQ